MNPLIIVALIVGVPVLLALVFRASSVYLFASVAAGGLLSRYLSDDVGLVVNTLLKDRDPSTVVQVALLTVPIVLTFVFLRGTLKMSRLALELVPLLASIAMLIVLLVPLLPEGLQDQVGSTSYGRSIRQAEDVVVGAAALLNLGLMWLINRKKHEEHGHHGKKRH